MSIIKLNKIIVKLHDMAHDMCKQMYIMPDFTQIAQYTQRKTPPRLKHSQEQLHARGRESQGKSAIISL